jgi:hypothetical protein
MTSPRLPSILFAALLAGTVNAAPPSTTTSAAAPVASTSATLKGSANPNGVASFAPFRYAPSNPGT